MRIHQLGPGEQKSRDRVRSGARSFHQSEIALHLCNRSSLATVDGHDEYLRLVVPGPVGSESNSLAVVRPDGAGIGLVAMRKLQRLTAISLS